MDSRPECLPAPDGPPTGAAFRRGVRVRQGLVFDVATEADPRDPVTRELALGVFPPICGPAFELMDALVPPSGRVLDLGAHVGSFSLASAASGRRVLAVEPSPRNFELLDASRRENRFHDLQIVYAAVGDHSGVVGFIPAGPFGYVAAGLNPVGGLDVRSVAVDDLLDEVEWDRVDFLKMDVEGSEVAALIGMSRTLRRSDAPPLFVESNGHTLSLFGETPGTLKATLAAYGYRIFQVERRRLIPVAIDELQPTAVVDYLAVKSTPLPPGRWRIDPPMTIRERLRRVRASLGSPIAHDRAYIAGALERSPASLRDDREVASPARPWYAPWRR